MSTRPDVLLIMWDQCAAKWVETAETHGVCELPNLRGLRAMGTDYTRCYSANPVCCPARATIATGMSTRQHGLIQNGYRLDESLPTFMRILQHAGWRSALAGKLHLHPHHAGVRPDYRVYGFDECHVTEDPRLGEWLDWVRETHPEHYDAAIGTLWTDQQAEMDADSGNGETYRTRWRAWLEEHGGGGRYEDVLPFPEAVSQSAWITMHARDILARQPADQPLFLQASYVQPHGPFTPPPGYLERVHQDRIPEPVPPPTGELPSNWRRRRALYFADLVHLDEQLGTLLDAQEARGRLQDTLILFTADHGDLLHDHGLGGKGPHHYDACVRVPLIVAGPGLHGGQTRDEFVQLEDLCPTILAACGEAEPTLPLAPGDPRGFAKRFGPTSLCHGRSLLPLCCSETPSDWRESAYCESYNNLESPYPAIWTRTLITDEWRYSVTGDHGGDQLYHLASDPDEEHDRSDDPACRNDLHALREALLHRIILQDAPGLPRGCYALGVH